MSALIRLYPPAWRKRYEAEFLALLEARPPTLYDRFDILRGALDARLHPQVRHEEEAPEPAKAADGPDDTVVVRRLGYGALAGGVAWIVGWWFGTVAAPVVYDGYGPHREGGGAWPLLILSVILLVAGLIGHLIVLPSTRRVARIGAIAAIPLLLMWMLAPWNIWFGLLVLVALFVFGLGSFGAPHWSAAAIAGLVVGSAAIVFLALVSMGLVSFGVDLPYEALFVITVASTPIWLSIGGPLTRVRPAVPAA